MKIDLLPGVDFEPSLKRNQGAWREVNLVRWKNSTLVPMLGWEKLTYATFPSPVRIMHRWTLNNGVIATAYFCEQHCFVDLGEGLVDISPIVPFPPVLVGDFAYGGYGDGDYGTIEYGTVREAFPRKVAATPVFSIDNWGQNLLVMSSLDGRLMQWDPEEEDGILEIVDGAPENNRSFVVTPERHVMLFGAGGLFARYAWCDEEDLSNWEFADITSKAGFNEIEPKSPIIASRKVIGGVVVFTNKEIGVITPVGLPFVYGYKRIGEAQAPYSPFSMAETPEGVVWASANGFWTFNGVNASAVISPVWWWVDKNIDKEFARYTAFMFDNVPTSELWWLFPSVGSGVNNRYVSYNYRDNLWSMGYIRRNCGLSYPNDPNPLMADSESVFSHEVGYSYPGADQLPWAETHSINPGNKNMVTIVQLMPEMPSGGSRVNFRTTKVDPMARGSTTMSDPKTVKVDGRVDVRETSRDLRIRISSRPPPNNGAWELGSIEAVIVGRGEK